MRAAIGLLLPSLAVYLWLGVGRSTGPSSSISRALRAAVAPGLGLGLASCFYLFFLVFSSSHARAVRIDLLFWTLALVSAAGFAFARPRQSSAAQDHTIRMAHWPAPTLIASAVVFAAAAVLAAAAFATRISIAPHGEWDAWAIWNLRARALWRGAPDWPAIFSKDIAWSLPDYPLLLPMSVARLWAYAGKESTAVPALIAATFLGASVATIVVSIGELRGWPAGLLGGTMLLVPRSYVFDATCQCADVPLGFFTLVALACAALAVTCDEERRWRWVVCGLAAGLAGWTKNEGQLLLAVVAVFVAVALRRNPGRTVPFLAGAAMPFAALVFFKLRLVASPNYLFAPTAIAGIRGRLEDVTRWSFVLETVASMIGTWGQIPTGALAILAAVVALTARDVRRSLATGLCTLGLLGVVMTGYITIFVITPLPLEWQVGASLGRLLSQLWPTLVWAGFQFAGVAKHR